MTQVMKGIRVLDISQFMFVPTAGALMADWGADVIKIEHPLRGDTQRGFINIGGIMLDPQRNTGIEHANRGKRSIGIDLTKAEGQQLLYEIVRTADVFLTNYLPAPRQKLKIDVEHIRAVNPQIIYARGSALGDKGPERENGGFNVFAREVEDVLVEHPAVRQAAVIGVPDPKWGEAVKAVVVIEPGAKVEADELIALVRDRKGAVQAPKTVDFVDAMPLSAVGKPDKKVLRQRYLETAE